MTSQSLLLELGLELGWIRACLGDREGVTKCHFAHVPQLSAVHSVIESTLLALFKVGLQHIFQSWPVNACLQG